MRTAPTDREGTRRGRAVLLAASVRAVRGHGLRLPVVAAVVITVASAAVPGSYGAQVLVAVAVVLGFALQSAVDDPERSILAATPHPLARRTLARVAAAGIFVVPVWLLAATGIGWRSPAVPVAALALQAVTLWTVATTVAAGAWRISASPTPSYVASPVLLGMVLVGNVLPRQWQLFDAQPWGPPWVAAQLRWCGLLLVATGLLGMLLSDPMGPRRSLPRSVRGAAPASPSR